MAYVIPLLTSLVIGVTCAQFAPGCSFTDGQCMYNVQLGHQGQCDKRAVTSGGGDCCDTIQSQVTGLTSDVNTLKSQMSTLMSELTGTKGNLSEARDQLTEAERQTQQLLDALAEKEAELNTTQSELSEVIGRAGEEIRFLRELVSRLTSDLNTCKGTLGLATNTTSLPVSSILPPDATFSSCDFEGQGGSGDVYCGFTTNRSVGFSLGSGRISSMTGPLEDHTLGSPHGHYIIMDARNITLHNPHLSRYEPISLTSPQYPPGPGYCIRFWYNMFGTDVRDLNVYIIIGSGTGYPVFSRNGDAGQKWLMGEIDLDSEYTSHPFTVKFSATKNTYRYGSSLQYEKADVALDDIYVYNTSCKNIPQCPSDSVTRESGGITYCYTFHVQPATWYEAAILCRQQSATTSLVTVTSQAEQDFIVGTIRNDTGLTVAGQYGFYTAGNDEQHEHAFEWTDTGTPYRATYSNWKTGQPNNVAGDQDCLLLQYPDLDFQWGDVDCDERHPFICKTQHPTPMATGAQSGSSPLIG